jgi:small-conductance mechanosensitive channel
MRLFYLMHEERSGRIFVDLMSSGIQFTLRFLVPIGGTRGVKSRISRLILERFRAHVPPIEFAHETLKIINGD